MAAHAGVSGHGDESHGTPALSLQRIALFLDVDGTLLELAERPDAVRVEPSLPDLLRQLAWHSGGAVALVSGRSIDVLDALFAGLLLPSAGLHGAERRSACGIYRRHHVPSVQVLDRARRLMAQIAARHPALVLEDKHFALALHYRQAPQLEREVVADVLSLSRVHAFCDLEIQRGRMVIELRPRSASKGSAVADFMEEAPFRGRLPVYLGDDLTDETAFQWVNSADGLSIAVNAPRETAARHRFGGVTEVHAWLARLLETHRNTRVLP